VKRLAAAIPTELFDALHEAAKRRDRTVSETATDLLGRALGIPPVESVPSRV